MARIPMTGGFQIMPEGEQVLKITAAEYDEDFGKLILPWPMLRARPARSDSTC